MPHITWTNLHEAPLVVGTRVTVDQGMVMDVLSIRGYVDIGEQNGKRVFCCKISGVMRSTLQALSRTH